MKTGMRKHTFGLFQEARVDAAVNPALFTALHGECECFCWQGKSALQRAP